MSTFGSLCLVLLAMVTVSGLAMAFYASMPQALLMRADGGRFSGLAADRSLPTRFRESQGAPIGPLQDQNS